MRRRAGPLILFEVFCLSVALAAQAPKRIHVPENVIKNFLLKRPIPAYSEDARKAHIQGSVVLKVVIGLNGHVMKVGVVSGPPQLVPAAIVAVRQSLYQPYTVNKSLTYTINGYPVEVVSRVQIDFALDPPITLPPPFK